MKTKCLILYLIISLVSCVQSIEINLSQSYTHSFKKGDKIQIVCPIDLEVNGSMNIITWYKDNQKIISFYQNSRIEIEMEKMTISELSPIDSGIYECETVNGNGKISRSKTLILKSKKSLSISKEFNLKNNPPSKSLRLFKNYHEKVKTLFYYEETSLKLDCLETGTPYLSILWYKNGRVISEEEYGIVRDKMYFKINRLYSSDSGVYRCQVTNEHGQINRYFQVQVAGVEKLTIEANKPISFECSNEQAQWFIFYQNRFEFKSNHIKIGQDTFYKLNSSKTYLTYGNKLMIINPSILDNGKYVCVANERVLSSNVFDLDVIEFRTKSFLNNENKILDIPLSIIVIVVLSFCGIFLIVVLLGYYFFKLRSKKETNLEFKNLSISKLNQQRQISTSFNHLSQDLALNNYFNKRYSHVPSLSVSTPNGVVPDKMSLIFNKTSMQKHALITNPTLIPLQLNYYPIYNQNKQNQSLLNNQSNSTRTNSQKSFIK